jgi:hypothetical protein
VKRVVWHEVAHWLGHDEEEVKELGLTNPSLGVEDLVQRPLECEAPKTVLQPCRRDTFGEAGEAKQPQPRCLKCHSADLTCPKLDKPLTYFGAWRSDPVPAHAKICACNSCGYEWDDEDNP